MKLTVARLLALAILLPLCSSCGYAKNDNRTAQIFAQGGVIREGVRLVEAERFEEALLKFNEALNPRYIGKERDKSSPHYYRALTYRIIGQYSLALKESDISMTYAGNPPPSDTYKEMVVLAQYESTGNKQLVLDYIEEYIKTRKFPVYQDTIAQSTLIRLYDAIGEYDKGIEFIDGYLKYVYDNSPDFVPPASIEEAERLAEWKAEKSHPRRRAYKEILVFLRCKEGFELDKQQGTKGRATRAILPSDRLPW